MKYKPNYAKQFEEQLGNPIEQVNGLIKKVHTLSVKQKLSIKKL